ncbi:MAG: HipA domain-containing protein, partial [bacterium]
HTFENIVKVIRSLFGGPMLQLAAKQMTGYLVLDALVGNTDRHHQNWGIVLEAGAGSLSIQLAPTFDHASSLGRELSDEARIRLMRENGVERYIRKGRGGIFENAEARHGMSPIDLAFLLAQKFPDLFRPWQEKVAALALPDLTSIINRVPEERMSVPARDFALTLVTTSCTLLQTAL